MFVLFVRVCVLKYQPREGDVSIYSSKIFVCVGTTIELILEVRPMVTDTHIEFML